MRLYIKYDINQACRVILQEQLEKLDIKYQLLDLGEIEFKETISQETYDKLHAELERYGIELLDNQKSQLIQRIKDTIVEMVYEKDKLPTSTISSYLADRLNLSYGYI